jgi:hypothetical protein
MHTRTFLKGAFAGGVGATAVLAATTAIAGTGVGAVFNLGKTNSVNATTALTGATAGGAQLAVENTSTAAGATGLSVTAPNGKPPITLSNSTLNPKLNAQFLNGLQASGVGRVALGSNEDLVGGFDFSTLATVTVTAPAKGFVRVDGRVFAWDGDGASACHHCEMGARIHDVSSGANSPRSFYVLSNPGTNANGSDVPINWVFPVTAGTHSYTLDVGSSSFDGGPMSFHDPVLIAQFVPFGGTGSSTSLGASTVRSSVGGVAIGR